MHWELPELPVCVAEPAGQGEHPDDPDKAEIVPGWQDRHAPEDVAPITGAKVPAAQSVQRLPDRYDPTRHAVHGASGPLAERLYVNAPVPAQTTCGVSVARVGTGKPGSCTGASWS